MDDPDRDDVPSAQDLAAAIHETTNALTVILGWIERARDAAAGNHDAETALARAARYTHGARGAMRRAIGAYVPHGPPEPAVALAERAAEDLAVEAKRADVRIVVVGDEAAGRARVTHPDTAWQILTNLLLNAVAVSPARGEVRVEVESSASVLQFRVHDEGPGVPAELREGIFSAGIAQRRGGAGIGLRHAYSLASDRGGELALVAGESGRGACFQLTWPAAQPSTPWGAFSPEPTQPDATQLDGSGMVADTARSTPLADLRVLLLEDDARVIELLELSLSARGATVTSVRTAEELGAELESGSYDIMLVDLSPLAWDPVTMGPNPGVRGVPAVSGAPGIGPTSEPGGLDAAVAKAREQNPAIAVVVISGSVTVRPRNDVIWIRKPFEPRELVDAIVRARGST